MRAYPNEPFKRALQTSPTKKPYKKALQESPVETRACRRKSTSPRRVTNAKPSSWAARAREPRAAALVRALRLAGKSPGSMSSCARRGGTWGRGGAPHGVCRKRALEHPKRAPGSAQKRPTNLGRVQAGSTAPRIVSVRSRQRSVCLALKAVCASAAGL